MIIPFYPLDFSRIKFVWIFLRVGGDYIISSGNVNPAHRSKPNTLGCRCMLNDRAMWHTGGEEKGVRWWSNTNDIPKSGAGQKETPSANNTPRQQHSRPRNNWLPCLVVDAMKISTLLLLFSRALITELARCHTPNGAFCFTIMLERTLGREFKSFFHFLLIVLRYW